MKLVRSDRPLPGYSPGVVTAELLKLEGGYWRLTVNAAQGRGFLLGQHADVYDQLSAEEALDVLWSAVALLIGAEGS